MTDYISTMVCLVEGDDSEKIFGLNSLSHPTPFPEPQNILQLKGTIYALRPERFEGIRPEDLIIWKAFIPYKSVNRNEPIKLSKDDVTKLHSMDELSKVLPLRLPKNTIHIIVQRPPSDSHLNPQERSRLLPNLVEEDLLGVEEREYLDKFCKTDAEPIQEFFRGNAISVGPTGERPSFLLDNISSTLDPKASSQALWRRFLETRKERNRVLAIIGTSGCGKTRTCLEVLGAHYGIFFTAVQPKSMIGSSDLSDADKEISKLLKAGDYVNNWRYAEMIAGRLLFIRLAVLRYLLRTDSNLTPKRWLMFQLMQHRFCKDLGYPTTSFPEDLFQCLMRSSVSREVTPESFDKVLKDIYDLIATRLDEGQPIADAIGVFPIFLDEAQILQVASPDSFRSRSNKTIPRSVLSPILAGMTLMKQKTIYRSLLCVGVSGTGLGLVNLESVAGSGLAKMDGRPWRPFTNFGCWNGEDHIRKFVKDRVDMAMDDPKRLLEKFRGRYRPLLTCLEYFLMHPESTMEEAIDQTFKLLTTAQKADVLQDRSFYHLFEKVEKMQEHRRMYLGIVMNFFLRGECFHFSNTAEKLLVETGFGRLISDPDKVMASTVDEPFVMEAGWNYYSSTNAIPSGLLQQMVVADHACSQGLLFEYLVPDMMLRLFEGSGDLNRHEAFRSVTQTPGSMALNVKAKVRIGPFRVSIYRGSGNTSVSSSDRTSDSTSDVSSNVILPTHQTLLQYLSNPSRATFYFPSKNCGPDLIFFVEVKLHGGKVSVPVLVQVKYQRNPDWGHTVATTNLDKLFTTKDGEWNGSVDDKDIEAVSLLKSMRPHGFYFRVIVAFPAKPREETIPCHVRKETNGFGGSMAIISHGNIHQYTDESVVRALKAMKGVMDDKCSHTVKKAKTSHSRNTRRA
ncbi:hypothetical protein EMPS_00345 [Entomortierella parvispora]|uniref:Crinkler effector protein N-terminal domain-containing protein n=1 Tax=Entomortierella parvispora TaxID=205924 RepID=A0A9P3H0M0_9FUNG|nr:hypothetical protein EMPS_00345 [Entomortierella parvispora]